MTEFSFRWGIPLLDEATAYVPIYRFMLRNYAKAGVTRDEFLCITHLADYRYETENGESSPSIGEIANQMGYAHENSVRNLIKSLKRKGLMTDEKRSGKTNVYEFSGFSNRVLQLWLAEQAVLHPNVPLHQHVGLTLHPNVPPPLQPIVPKEEKPKEIGKRKKKTTSGAGVNPEKKTDSVPRSPDPLFDAIVKVCHLDPKIDGSYIGKTKRSLTKMEKSAADVLAFELLWYANDWRGQKGQAPTQYQLVTEITKLLEMGSAGGASGDQFDEHGEEIVTEKLLQGDWSIFIAGAPVGPHVLKRLRTAGYPVDEELAKMKKESDHG